MEKLWWFFIVILLLISSCKPKQDSQSKDLKKITVGITSSFIGEAAIYVAQQKNIFRDYGLNVSLKQNASGGASIRDLFNNHVDIAHVAETPIVYALIDTSYYNGKTIPDFQIIANLIYADELQKIIGRKDHGVVKGENVKGKKIALSVGTQLEYYLDSFLLEYQIPEEHVTRIDMTAEEQIEAISSGKVDVAVNWEPFATQIQQNLDSNGISLKTKLNYSTLWMVTTLETFAQDNPKILTAYLQALQSANQYIRENTFEVQQLLAKKIGVPHETVELNWDKIEYELSLSERMMTLFEDQERWLIKKEKADTSNLNYMEIINTVPMSKVYPDGITLIQ